MAFHIHVIVILCGLIAGWMRRGSIWAIPQVRLRVLWLLPIAYVMQYISIRNLTGAAYQWTVVGSYLAIFAFCLLNVKFPGIIWTLAGSAANFLVMAVNGLRMPTYLPAVRQIDPRLVPLLLKGELEKSVAMTAHTHLNFLGDIFFLRVPPESLISVGDLIFAVGLVILIQHAMCANREGTFGGAAQPQVAD